MIESRYMFSAIKNPETTRSPEEERLHVERIMALVKDAQAVPRIEPVAGVREAILVLGVKL
ncbi:hypothetical protein GOZ78_03605 [Agrobacterium vitis]|uniref:hypothetical protein n=1 Tax=Agrobacterium vitis TaxID=373 RepID=UPI0012E7E62E|nr:hypothetical protein [Agrobacterium vitis]MVA09105.1 hypothetical protein [Agrobacterium vitis]